MRIPCSIAIVVLLSAANVFAGERRITFDKEDAVYVASPDGSGVKKVADGIFPALSPDGTRVAYNTVEKTGTTYVRHIAVTDLASGQTTVFKDIPSENSYYASWSPDGNWILFTYRRDQVWDIAVVRPDGRDFKVVKKGVDGAVTLYSPCWAGDGQSIFCQDMTNIYRIGVDGAAMGQWKIDKIVPNADMSGDGRISVSPDGKRLLLSVEMGEEHHRKDWDGPPPALWSFDLETQKATRLTNKNLFAWNGVWLDAGNLLFMSKAAGDKEACVYRMSIDGKGLKKLTSGGDMPNVGG
jgi:TolB protein